MSIKVEIEGKDALFTMPEMKAERASYCVITPSAARGIIEAIFFHPGLRWHIDRIHVLAPIKFANLRRNEVKSKILASSVLSAANGTLKTPYIATSNDIQQRASLFLQDVHYVVEAHFTMTDRATPSDNPGKFQDIVKRRLRKGQFFTCPYLGCRECVAKVRLWEGGDIPAIPETRDLGWILYDMDYSDPCNIRPIFFRARMVNGVIDVSDREVVR